MKPVLRAFVPCLDIVTDPSGTLHLRGVMQHVVVLQLPIVIEIRVYMAWSELEDRDYDMRVVARAPGAEETRSQNYHLGRFDGINCDRARDLWLREKIVEPGDIVFEVFLEGELHATYRLPVLHQPPQEPPLKEAPATRVDAEG